MFCFFAFPTFFLVAQWTVIPKMFLFDFYTLADDFFYRTILLNLNFVCFSEECIVGLTCVVARK